MQDMKMSVMGCCELAEYECIALKCYLDSGGVKTFGAGSTVSDIPDIAKWSWDVEHPLQEAVDIYVRGLEKYVSAVNKALTVQVKQHEFDALVSLTYNIGTAGFRNSTALRLVNAKASEDQVIAAMARWRNDNGRVVQGLINRRAKEAKLYRDAFYGTNGLVSVVPVRNKKPVYAQGKKVNLIPYLEEAFNKQGKV